MFVEHQTCAREGHLIALNLCIESVWPGIPSCHLGRFLSTVDFQSSMSLSLLCEGCSGCIQQSLSMCSLPVFSIFSS